MVANLVFLVQGRQARTVHILLPHKEDNVYACSLEQLEQKAESSINLGPVSPSTIHQLY